VFPGRRSAAFLWWVMCAGLALMGATGCAGDPDAGTNGVAKLPPKTIEQRARSAADAAATVRLSGTVSSNGSTYKLDMRLRGNGGLGQVTAKGSTFQLLRVGDELYLKAGAGFYGDEVGDKLKNKYVKVPTGDPAYKQFSGFTDKKVLLDGLFVLDGELAIGDHRSVGGTRTIALTGAGGSGGTLDVSLEGKPYPLRYERAGGAGTLTLADWGKDFTLRAPDADHVVDYGKSVTS
jgi:hypothetical protein